MVPLLMFAASEASAAPPLEVRAHPPGVELTEAICPPCFADPTAVTASSTLTEGHLVHGIERASDGDRRTAWCEGDPGDGVGASITFSLPADASVHGLRVITGYALDEAHFRDNTRLARLRIEGGGRVAVVSFPDLPDGPASMDAIAAQPWEAPLDLGRPGAVRLTVEAVYPGRKYADLCLSELSLYLATPI